MKSKTAIRFSLLLCWLCFGVTAMAISQDANVTLGARDDGTGNLTLLVQIVKASETALQEGSKQTGKIPGASIHLDTVDEIRIKTGEKDERKTGILFLPPGWKEERHGEEIRFSGPPISAEDGCHLSLNLGKTKIPKDIPVQIFSGGKKIADQRIGVVLLPTPTPVTSLKDLPTMPRCATPGEEIHFTAMDPRQTPEQGKWTVGSSPAEKISSDSGGIRYRVQIPQETQSGTNLSVRYMDPWGNQIVNISDSNGIKVLTDGKEVKPRIVSTTPKTFAGNVICVCGWFPNHSSEKLMIDGKPAGVPLGDSIGTVHLLLSRETSTGNHVITGDPAAGFTSADQATTQVLQVGGELDRTKLFRGESTPMRLWVRGTEEPMQLRVRNLTPPIITIEGGNDQMIPTSGGAANQLQRNVRGVSVGNFEIKYELATDPCPCAANFE